MIHLVKSCILLFYRAKDLTIFKETGVVFVLQLYSSVLISFHTLLKLGKFNKTMNYFIYELS